MATTTNANNATTTNANNANVPNYDPISRKIKDVVLAPNSTKRLIFTLDGDEFETLKDGKETMSNTFGIDIFPATQQLAELVPEIQLACGFIIECGKVINPQILKLALLGADVTISRTFKAKGEKREATNDVYTNDVIKSTFTAVTTHIDEMRKQLIMQLIMTKPTLEIKTNVIPNPFGI